MLVSFTTQYSGEQSVANTAQAKKRIRQAQKHQQHNISMRSSTRTHLKKTVKALAAGDQEAASTAYKLAVPVLDKMVNKGIIHKNKAARHKSRLNKHLKAMALAPQNTAKKKKSKATTTDTASTENPSSENTNHTE